MTVHTTRRTIGRAAWAIPVVAAVAPAPAYAASAPPIRISSFGASCKLPGQSVPGHEYGYRMFLTFEAAATGTIHIDQFLIDGAPTTDMSPTTFAVAAGTTTVELEVYSTNSAQRSATITYSYNPIGSPSGQYTEPVPFASFKPCKS